MEGLGSIFRQLAADQAVEERRAPIERSTGPLFHFHYLSRLLVQKLICKHKGLIPDPNVKACQPIGSYYRQGW